MGSGHASQRGTGAEVCAVLSMDFMHAPPQEDCISCNAVMSSLEKGGIWQKALEVLDSGPLGPIWYAEGKQRRSKAAQVSAI